MATFTVINLDNSGAGSLRNAIFRSNRAGSTDIIDFDTTLSGGTINLISRELRIRDDLTINGLGADLLSVDAGDNSFRVLNVDDGDLDNDLEVAINGLTITGGGQSDYSDGGGILNRENLTVTNSTISGNRLESGESGRGGGIFSDGTLTVTNSTISGNRAYDGGGIFSDGGDLTVTNSTISYNTAIGPYGGGDGGGILNSGGDLTVTNSTIYDNFADFGGGITNGGTLTVTNSTISGNQADATYGFGTGGGIDNGGYLTVTNSTISGNSANEDGGGIYNSGDLTVSNSTISGNSALGFAFGRPSGYGGGIYNSGDLTVSNSTISGNTAESRGGGIYNDDGYSTVTSSIIAANTNNEDIDGDPFTSGGNNLIGNGDGAIGFTNGVDGDIVGTAANPIDPQLGPLQDNGGPTLTQALLPSSLAIDAGSNLQGLEFDQRGPGFNRVIGAQADIGAVEAVPEPGSTAGLLGLAILGGVLMLKRQRRQKTKVMKEVGDSLETLHDRTALSRRV